MRYALGVEYDGSDFKGWQQLGESGCASVQATLQDALSSVANAPVSVVCAGRTDAGVHGECQVVHFDSDVSRDPRGWVLGTTTRLPPSVRCAGACRWPMTSMHGSRPGRGAIATGCSTARCVRRCTGRR
jgi:Pseudouridylate synthase